MSKSVLIVEKDTGLIGELREALTGRGFEVEDTTDGKGAPELIRKTQPGAVVLAVDLDAGQNGYIICKKLKSDDDLKSVPVIIIGDPKGFAQHQKLKTRAEEYVGKPLEASTLVDVVGRLIGFPEVAAAAEEGFDPGSLLDDDGGGEVVLEEPIDEGNAEADLSMVDSMFEESPAVSAQEAEEEISVVAEEEEFEAPPERTVIGFMPTEPPVATGVRTMAVQAFSPPASSPSTFDAGSSELRSKVTELTGALEDAKSKQDELETRIRELESELESKSTELETARASSGKSDNKEVFALREAGTKKDKEILRLKNELNAKEQELVEAQEKHNSLEQQQSEGADEHAKKDAQIKTLTAKADALAADKKKVDQQLTQAKEEARSASAKLSTLQSDFDAMQSRVGELEGEIEALRTAQQELESSKQSSESELSEARGELEAVKSELENERNQNTGLNDELSSLRQRLADAEAEVQKAEEKAGKHQARARAHQEQLERVKSTLQQAMDTLSEAPADADDIDIDDIAEA